MSIGTVYLVGAGPGDPGLLTVRGRQLLESCDVVVFDRLANPALLRLARPEAELIDVGKAPNRVASTQEETNRLLVDLALAGRSVCRLKGGDPFVFGRGGEEALECRVAGVPFEVVPGVTSAIAAAAYAGIPVTHRAVATSFAVITGHEDPTKPGEQVDWAGIAGGAETLVFLMGIGHLPEISARLIEHGRDPATPAAAVRWGTRPEQRTVTGTLATLPAAVAAAGLKPPAAVIVGEVVRLRERLDWFECRPLHGRCVVVTRSRTQASELVGRLESLGAEVIVLPVIAIEPVDATARMRELVAAGMPFEWLVFTSTNAVERFVADLDAAGGDARLLAGCRLGAVGEATAAALRAHCLRADYVPSSFDASTFAAEFPAARGPVLFPCGRKARDTVPAALAARGLTVETLVLYDTVLGTADAQLVRERLAGGAVDAVTFTASSTVQNFRALLPEADLTGVCLASIGPQTSATLRELALEPTVEAEQSSLDGLVSALSRALEQRQRAGRDPTA